jgi:predicted ATPase
LEAHHQNWANFTAMGELTAAWLHMEQGFRLYDPQKYRDHALRYGGHDPGVCCGYHAAEVLWFLGYPDHALRRSRESLKLARELAHPSTSAFVTFFAATFHQLRGEKEAVWAQVEECLAIANEHGFSRWQPLMNFLQGWLLSETGQSSAGITKMSEMLSSKGRSPLGNRWSTHCAALLADAHRKIGQTIEGLSVVTDALSMAQSTDCRYYEAELHRIKGELLLTQTAPDDAQAESCFRQAIEVACRQEARSLELRAAMSMSRLWQRQGKKAEAQKLLAEIYGWFTEGFDTADLKSAKTLLEELA